MQTIDIHDAQERLTELVDTLPTSGDVLITRGSRPVARLSATGERPSLRNLKPASVGGLLRPFPDDDGDLLGEMLDP